MTRQKIMPRHIDKSRYKTELCKKWLKNGMCPYGIRCQFAHGDIELHLPPLLKRYIPPPAIRPYRTKLSVRAKVFIPSQIVNDYHHIRPYDISKHQQNTPYDEDYELYWDLIQSTVRLGRYAKQTL